MRARRTDSSAPTVAPATPARRSRAKTKHAAWTRAEEALLRRVYPKARRSADVLAHFPTRSWHSVHCHAKAIGLRFGRLWSPEEDAALKEMWPETGRRTILAKIDRSWVAVVHRANELGIVAQRWKGYATVTKAMKRAGYDRRLFNHVLAAYAEHFKTLPPCERSERPAPTTAVRGRAGAKKVIRVVDAQTAVDAAEWWESLETRAAAIRRIGAPVSSMAAAVRRAGLKMPPLDRRPAEFWDALWRDHAPPCRPEMRRPRAKRSAP